MMEEDFMPSAFSFVVVEVGGRPWSYFCYGSVSLGWNSKSLEDMDNEMMHDSGESTRADSYDRHTFT